MDFYPELYSCAVISQVLKNKSIEFNISVVPKIVEVGIHFDLFYQPVQNSLKNIGYGGAKETINFFGEEISRYDHLVTFDGLPTKKKLEMMSQVGELPIQLHELINKLKQKFTINKE